MGRSFIVISHTTSVRHETPDVWRAAACSRESVGKDSVPSGARRRPWRHRPPWIRWRPRPTARMPFGGSGRSGVRV